MLRIAYNNQFNQTVMLFVERIEHDVLAVIRCFQFDNN